MVSSYNCPFGSGFQIKLGFIYILLWNDEYPSGFETPRVKVYVLLVNSSDPPVHRSGSSVNLRTKVY